MTELYIPKVIKRAIDDSSHGPSDPSSIGVTTLVGPPMLRQLKARYYDRRTKDYAGHISALIGQSWDKTMGEAYKALAPDALIQERIESSISFIDHEGKEQFYTLRGAVDFFHPSSGLLIDDKLTSAYVVQGDGVKPEWQHQLRIYKWVLEKLGYTVTKMISRQTARDSKFSEIRRGAYTDVLCVDKTVESVDAEETEAYIKLRMREHYRVQQAEYLTFEHACSEEERWATKTKYAVTKIGGKRAFRLCPTKADAEKLLATKPGYKIDVRPGANIRCERYCTEYRQFCPFWIAQTKGQTPS